MARKPKEKITAADCVKCGACCISFFDQDGYCDVTYEDMERLGKRFVRLHVLGHTPFDRLAASLSGDRIPDGVIETKWRKQRSGPLKNFSLCSCVALRGSVMHKTSCSVYETRPDACRRAMKPGDKSCRELRQAVRDLVAETA